MTTGVYSRKPMAQATKDKIRLKLLGNKNGIGNKASSGKAPWNKGIPVSDEHKKYLSEVQKGKHNSPSTEIRKGSRISPLTEFKMGSGGSSHHSWKGGITRLAERIRKSFKYRQWRSDVYSRDDYTCECGIRGGKLHAHHIKTFSIILKENNIDTFEKAMECEELWNINNGKTLCVPCHKETDSYLKVNK